MLSLRIYLFFALGLLLAACVTVNIYFPAAAAEQAADQVISNVWGTEQPPPANGTKTGKTGKLEPGEANLDISSPAVQALQQSMAQRHEGLEIYYDEGKIALTNDALIILRKPAKIPLKDRSKLKNWVTEENKDRVNLYRQIAAANGHPEWEAQIRAIFAKRWIEKAEPGWWYQDENKQWQRKE
jgi:hypothetical protein